MTTEDNKEEQIKNMINRFLQWRLPESFNPDGGISFEPEYNVEYMAKQGLPPARHEPVGTNLFSVVEADAMVRYMLEDTPQNKDDTMHAHSGWQESVKKPIDRIIEIYEAADHTIAASIIVYLDEEKERVNEVLHEIVTALRDGSHDDLNMNYLHAMIDEQLVEETNKGQ